MTIKFIIQQPPQEQTPVQQQPQLPEQEKESTLKVKMNLRRALDGSIMIFDHKSIDIVINTKKLKVSSFTKGDFSDHVYATQNRCFEFLAKKGIIDPSTIKGGHVYGSLEAKLLQPEDNIPLDQIIILNISKWMDEERPQMEFEKHYEEHFEEYLTEPDTDDSTELGEVPQEEEQGTIPKDSPRRYFGGWF